MSHGYMNIRKFKMTPRVQHIVEDGIEKKRCCSCQIYRSLDNFNNSSRTWDNLRPECKVCLKEKRDMNKDKMTEYNKQYWEKTKDAQKEKCKQWRENNKEHVKEKMQEWLSNNKEHKKQKDKEYREANREKRNEQVRIWKQNNYQDLKTNPDRVDEFNSQRIKSNVSRRIREILKQHKSRRAMEYVGCSLEDLKQHLEKQFQEGMSWDNYGIYKFGEEQSGWHIDHIIPCAGFNLQDEFEKNACFYYKNLQPLWGKDNIIKSDTFEYEVKTAYLNEYRNIINT